jgi:type I restriction enzyme S subunit
VKTLRLKDLGRWYSGGTPPRERLEHWDGDVPWISAKDIDSTRLRAATTFITLEAALEHSRMVPAGALLLIVRGMALAHGLPVVETDMPVAFNQDLRALVCAPGIAPRFVYYSLIGHRWRLNAHVDQAAHGTARVNDSIYSERIPVPDRRGQRAVAEFLDRECDRIRAVNIARVAQMDAIAALQQAWLDEAMASAPTAAPTRLRDLLGSSPCYGVLVPRFSDAHGVPFIRVSDLSGLQRRVLPMIEASQSAEYSRTVVSAGDVLVSVVGSVDRSAIVPESLAGANVARAVARLQPARGVPSFFLWACTRTSQYKEQALLFTSADTAQPTLNMGDLSRFRLSAPRSAEERAAIELRLRAGFEVSDDLATETLRAESALTEYRDALITEAVTGQLDVTRMSGAQMDECLAAVREGERPEILAS